MRAVSRLGRHSFSVPGRPVPGDSPDKGAICSRFSTRSRRTTSKKADREEKPRRTPTLLFARRSGRSRRPRMRERIVGRLEWPRWRPRDHEPSSWGDTPGDKRLGGCCLPPWWPASVDRPRRSQDHELSLGKGSLSGSMVWRWLEAWRMIEMGRRFVPPPPPTNRPQMRESGREATPLANAQDRFPRHCGGSLTPRLRAQVMQNQVAQHAVRLIARSCGPPRLAPASIQCPRGRQHFRQQTASEGTVRVTDQASHSRKAIGPASHASRLRDERDPVRGCPLHRRADRIRAQPGDRYRPREGQRLLAVADLTSGVLTSRETQARDRAAERRLIEAATRGSPDSARVTRLRQGERSFCSRRERCCAA